MIGEKIRLARRANGLSLRDLADLVGVSHTAIAKYEHGRDTPNSDLLLRIAKQLGVKIEYFFRNTTVNLSIPEYRKKNTLKRKQENAIMAKIEEWLERYLAVEELFPNQQVLNESVFPAHLKDTVQNPEESENIAEQLRDEWQLGLDPIENFSDLLEDRGIKVGLLDGSNGFDACTFTMGDGTPVIALSLDLPGDRQRFNLAHELGHFFVKAEDKKMKEKSAHRFAGAFLVPAQMARLELGKHRNSINLYELHLLKHKYGLSMQAWIYRAKDLGIISESSANGLFKLFRYKGWHKEEPGDTLPSEEPKRMERLVMRALAEDLISESRAAELLSLPLEDFWRKVTNEHDGLPAHEYIHN
ncbi:MAG: XRE family transcriptional regulator [Bacillota bacterium]